MKYLKYILSAVLFCSTLYASSLQFEGLTYKDLNVTPTQMCPVKQVPIEKNRDFVGVIVYKDNSFDVMSSAKYTFTQKHHVEKTKEKEVAQLLLMDYKTKKLIDANSAYYVFGSTLMSVGGDDIIPFKNEADAKEFKKEHKGKKIFKVDRMNENFINYLEIR